MTPRLSLPERLPKSSAKFYVSRELWRLRYRMESMEWGIRSNPAVQYARDSDRLFAEGVTDPLVEFERAAQITTESKAEQGMKYLEKHLGRVEARAWIRKLQANPGVKAP